MKRKTLLLIVACTVVFTVAIAQQKNTDSAAIVKHPMNLIKVNLTAILLKNYSFQYERILSRKVSIAIGYRTMPSSILPFQSTIIKLAGDDPDTQEQIRNFKLSNTAITPEIRFYMSKKGYGRGFYFAPFYRHGTYNGSNLKFSYSNGLAGIENSIQMSGKLSGNSYGLMLGAQWALGKHVSLDWWIIGPHYGTGNGEFKGIATKPLSNEEQANLKQTLEDLNIPLTKKTVTVNSAGAIVNLDGPFGGVRAGLLLGIRL